MSEPTNLPRLVKLVYEALGKVEALGVHYHSRHGIRLRWRDKYYVISIRGARPRELPPELR